MGKAVALTGTVIATPGQVPFPPAQSGAWVAMPVQETMDNKLKVGGKAVISEAECVFMFTGTDSSSGVPVPVSGQEKVKLSAKSTTLQKKVLVDGDMQQSSYGNRLRVITLSKLTTS